MENTIKLKRDVISQKHKQILEKRIYEDNANFLNPRELEINIYNNNTKEFIDVTNINNFLKLRYFLNKNWYNKYKINEFDEFGKKTYFIFANKS